MRFGCRRACCVSLLAGHGSYKRSVLLIIVLVSLTVSSTILLLNSRYPYSLKTAQQVSSENSINALLQEFDKNSTLNLYDVRKEIGESNYQCIQTYTRPSFTVCLFDIWHDVFISRSLMSAGIWEPHVVYEFIEALERGGPKSGVLDVGANIGYYSLLSARMNRCVIAVEPFIESIKRLHKAAHLDGTSHNIFVVHNAVAELRTTASLQSTGDNQGDTRIELKVEECQGRCPPVVNTIVLDDLVEVIPFRQGVMKIDIQGYEHHAFQRASRLFAAVHFTHIFMEWMMMREHYVAANHTSRDKELIEHMIRFLYIRNFRPYKLVYEGAKPLNPNSWQTWPLDIVWQHLPTADEQLQLARSHYMLWPQ